MGLLSYYYWAILMERDMISHLTDFNLPMGNLPFIDHHNSFSLADCISFSEANNILRTNDSSPSSWEKTSLTQRS
jgi:hypothetical protein